MPCLLLQGRGLVKTINFRSPIYVGDPVNTFRIFNQKEVDEIILIDIGATSSGSAIQFDLIEQIASECFMPICYGGGVRSIEDYVRLFTIGIEKISVSSLFFENPDIVSEAVKMFGSQSVVLTLDVKRHWLTKNYRLYNYSGAKCVAKDIIATVKRAEALGVGEIIVYSMERDGTWKGFDTELITQICESVEVPVVAVGGAGSLPDIKTVVEECGASAVGIGSMAVFQGQDKGVLVRFPRMAELEKLLGN